MTTYREAFALSKEEVKNAVPPGTVTLISHDLERTESGLHTELHDHTRLVPTPSADPADPLNWPAWRKYGILMAMSLWGFSNNFTSASLSSALPQMVMAFPNEGPKTFGVLTHLISVNVLMLGASNIFWVPMANTYGRRPIILFGTLALTLFSVWGGVAKSFSSLLAARFFMGSACGTAETVSPDIVGEVFFVHERGRAMAVYTVFLAMGPLIGGLSGSYIAARNGWRWIQWIDAILSGATFLACFFFQPETLFDRREAMDLSNGTNGKADSVTDAEAKNGDRKVEEVLPPSPNSHTFKPYTLARSLKIGGINRGGLLQKFFAQFLTIRFPGVWMVMLQYAGLVAGVVTVSVVSPQFVSEPPYLWGTNAGLVNLGGLVGSIIGGAYTYAVADRSLTDSAKHESHGFAEPEERLKTQFPSLTLASFGLWVFGAVGAHPGPRRWVGLEFGYGMLAFGLMQAPSVGFNYIIEAYNAVSGDCFVMIVLLRSLVSFAWTFFVGNWVTSAGPMEPFGIFGMLMAIFTLLTIPQYIWGKRTRIATERWLPKQADH